MGTDIHQEGYLGAHVTRQQKNYILSDIAS